MRGCLAPPCVRVAASLRNFFSRFLTGSQGGRTLLVGPASMKVLEIRKPRAEKVAAVCTVIRGSKVPK